MIEEHDARLGEALKEVGYPPSIIAKARAGYWSDFKTELAFPKRELVAMLVEDDHEDLAHRVARGEFDG